MTKNVPKLLATRHLYSDDPGKAAEEALRNSYRLVQAGQFEAALRVLGALVSPGPWRTSRNFAWRYDLLGHRSWLGQRLGRPPAQDGNDDVAEMARRDFPARAIAMSTGQFMHGRPPRPQDWSASELATIAATVRPDNFGGVFNDFQRQACEELQWRLAARLSGQSRADPGNHGALADTIERAALLAFPRDGLPNAAQVGMLAAVLDLLAGNPAATAARLGRLLPKLTAGADAAYWMIPAYAEFLASGALGAALGIDAAGATAYLDAFASRSPYTITSAKPRPWKQVLKAWVERLREDGLDADTLQRTLAAGAPASKALQARAKKGQPLSGAASEQAVAGLEARLGEPLPPSYREFLLVSDGLIAPDFVALLPAADVDWLHVRDPDTVAAWNRDGDEATDEQYAIYGADQDCVHMRARHLHRALQVSTSCDGDVLLLVPAVRFGDEWEAWFLGAKNPGAFRFKSFRALLEQQVLAE